jgi:hypothetical protein
MMEHGFIIKGLKAEIFEQYLALNDGELALRDAKWLTAESDIGYPCRVSLQDAQRGERVLALSYNFHDVRSLYKASGPIFVRENALTADLEISEIPKMLLQRPQSLRGYDKHHMMALAEISEGENLKGAIQNMLENPKVDYIQFHNANRGCFNCTLHRSPEEGTL